LEERNREALQTIRGDQVHVPALNRGIDNKSMLIMLGKKGKPTRHLFLKYCLACKIVDSSVFN